MARVIIVDLLTGRRVVDIPYVKYSWARRRNAPETLSCETTLLDEDVRALDLRNAATPGKTALAIIEEVGGGEWFAGAGPMNKPSYDRDSGRLTLTAAGVGDYFFDRLILPPSAATASTSTFIVPDPADATKTMPNPALATALSGWSLGTIFKKLVAQALSWSAGGIPIVLPADIVGTSVRRYEAVDFKSVGDAGADLTKVIGGPDIRFDARYQLDRRGIEWVLRTGTDGAPTIRSATLFRWDVTAENGSVKGLKVDYDTSELGSVSWATGGRSSDQALVARASDSRLTDAGYPLREVLDTSHTDVSIPATLQGYAATNLQRAQGATEVWSMQVKKDEAPYLGQYDIGDRCVLKVVGDPYIRDGEYTREIASMSGDEGQWVTIQTIEVGA